MSRIWGLCENLWRSFMQFGRAQKHSFKMETRFVPIQSQRSSDNPLDHRKYIEIPYLSIFMTSSRLGMIPLNKLYQPPGHQEGLHSTDDPGIRGQPFSKRRTSTAMLVTRRGIHTHTHVCVYIYILDMFINIH